MDLESEKQDEQINDTGAAGLSEIERDTIGEILNISMGSAATAVSTLLGRPVSITTPKVSIVKTQDFEVKSLEPAVGIDIQYIEGLNGANLLVMKRKDIRAIVTQLLGDEYEEENDDEPLSEMHMSAISEVMNQMMGSSCTALSNFLGNVINISTPKQFEIINIKDKLDQSQEFIVSVRFRLCVENLIDSEFITVMPVQFTKELVNKALHMGEEEVSDQSAPSSVKEAPSSESAKPVPNVREISSSESAKSVPNMRETASSEPAQSASSVKQTPEQQPIQTAVRSKDIHNNPTSIRQTPVSVQPLQWKSFDDNEELDLDEESKDNLNLILDVPLDVSVEIGRRKMQVKEVLELRQGSIVELDKQADEPVDIYVNGQIIAKGNVVVINDNFGVRVTEIISEKSLAGAQMGAAALSSSSGKSGE